ncbi:glycosyltransferase WbsX family protein [Butyrivibrio sp. WCD2001]|uniref:glycosyltransferase WbsX family protein n=1 Tax=Butyrivibrio sp. WCD2001 TaxID=1280681 RepID=UPI000677C6CB|nr:glycoside hydrolase family 99-like domain-containing protein [Butyrivibrio sp. WCD2001]
MKILTMYLPQFHRTKENDKWWGEGFTEWTAVKQAESLFEDHYQPKVPLAEKYYNLLDYSTMKWQALLMKKYGVDGQCFYHYYFKDGRKVLEKPAENLLEWKDIEMPFCFSWANESWIRSWSKYSGKEGNNAWFEKFDNATNSENLPEILLEQDYGSLKDWEEHFYYLLPFFRDDRYIKYNGHPVFMIYRPELIDCLDDMLKCWDNLANENDIKTPYIIGSPRMRMNRFDNVYCREPSTALGALADKKYKNMSIKNCYKYEDAWDEIIHELHEKGDILSGFVNYDDTPRRGSKGMVVTESSPELFAIYFEKLLEKAKALEAPFVFLNAWNEWGEGNYLEPDAKDKYAYLEAVRSARIISQQKRDIGGEDFRDYKTALQRANEKTERYGGYWKMLDKWLEINESGASVSQYLLDKGHKEIAIYGYGLLGRHLLRDCEKNGLKVKYVIDNRKELDIPYDVYKLEDQIPDVDTIVVAVSYDLESIETQIKDKIKSSSILRIESILGGMVEQFENG